MKINTQRTFTGNITPKSNKINNIRKHSPAFGNKKTEFLKFLEELAKEKPQMKDEITKMGAAAVEKDASFFENMANKADKATKGLLDKLKGEE